MRYVAEITLIENATAGNSPRTFSAQTVEIRYEEDTVVVGSDGIPSVAHHPPLIFWHGGKAEQLARVTDVKITAGDGELLIDGALNTTFTIPESENGGVRFAVLVRE
jgi:hypothetical protein